VLVVKYKHIENREGLKLKIEETGISRMQRLGEMFARHFPGAIRLRGQIGKINDEYGHKFKPCRERRYDDEIRNHPYEILFGFPCKPSFIEKVRYGTTPGGLKEDRSNLLCYLHDGVKSFNYGWANISIGVVDKKDLEGLGAFVEEYERETDKKVTLVKDY